jgi:hypothetical protein
MPEHYTKSTVEAAEWCNVCNKVTMHRVDHGRRGPCLECIQRREQQATARPKAPQALQGELFPDSRRRTA